MRNKKRFLRYALLVVIVFIASFVFTASGILSPDRIMSLFDGSDKTNYASTENGWNLILINKDNYIPEDYDVKLLKLSNGERIDERIYPELQQMFDDARATGLELFVAQGYRTAQEQQKLLEDKREAYEYEGKSAEEAKELAEQWVAVPGTSEHQLGIAVDINADEEKCKPDDVYRWLSKNAHKYGFIIRYPYWGENETGVTYEPWHLRYVGEPHAQIIYRTKIVLEEYASLYEDGEFYLFENYVISHQACEDGNFTFPIEAENIAVSRDNMGGYFIWGEIA